MKSLIELRTTLVGAIAVLTGGVMWLTFLDAPKYRYFFVVIGAYFICMLLASLMKTITELNTIIYKRRNIKMDNFDEIMGITVAIGFLAIFLWGQYGISKASRHDFGEDKK